MAEWRPSIYVALRNDVAGETHMSMKSNQLNVGACVSKYDGVETAARTLQQQRGHSYGSRNMLFGEIRCMWLALLAEHEQVRV